MLLHIKATEQDPESFYAIPARTLETLADALEAPTLLDRALAGDPEAARQFLHKAGIIGADGQLAPQYRTPES